MQRTEREKPAGCRQECGGGVPPPPAEYPTAHPAYQCGISIHGACPVLKSAKRNRLKGRRHRLKLWRRSDREYRLSVENAAIQTGRPENASPQPEGEAEIIARQARAAGFDPGLYRSVRQESTSLQEAVDRYVTARPKGKPAS